MLECSLLSRDADSCSRICELYAWLWLAFRCTLEQRRPLGASFTRSAACIVYSDGHSRTLMITTMALELHLAFRVRALLKPVTIALLQSIIPLRHFMHPPRFPSTSETRHATAATRSITTTQRIIGATYHSRGRCGHNVEAKASAYCIVRLAENEARRVAYWMRATVDARSARFST